MLFSGRTVHIDVPLTQVAIGYKPQGMIADLVAPDITVLKQSDGYYVFFQQDEMAVTDDKRAPGTEANIVTRRMSSGTFYCKNYALKDNIPYEDIENADAKMLMFERGARAEYILDRLAINRENRLASMVTSTSNVGSSSTVASAWTDHTNSDPYSDIVTGINVVEDLTGYRPNSILFSGYAWRNFRENSSVITRCFGNQQGKAGPNGARTVMQENAKALFEVERLIVANSYKQNAQEGQALNLAQIWGDSVLIYYAPMNPRKDVPSFMYTFTWRKIMDMQAKIFQMPRAEAEQVQVGYYKDEKITSANLAFLITGVGSSQ